MNWRSVRAAMLCASIAISLGACAASDGLGRAPIDPSVPNEYRVTLPAPPAGVGPCLARAFPAIPDRALTRADIVSLVAQAKLLDRAKTQCGARATRWIDETVQALGKPPT